MSYPERYTKQEVKCILRKQKIEHMKMMYQKMIGLGFMMIGILASLLLKDCTIGVMFVPVGTYVVLTKEYVLTENCEV